MSKKMLINASHPEENRVAIVVDGILSELDIEIAGQEQTKGNIYKAVVVRVESGLQAAFVDYGAEKMGFLQIGEIHPNIYPATENPDAKNRPRINDILQRGQELLVQIVKEERGTKGAALTTFLSLPGRYMVLMPDSKTKGVSRKITEESERKQLKKTMAALDLPERMGYIVRTAGIGKEQEELKRDFDYLVSLYQGIAKRKEQVKAPAQLYQESNLVIRSIRDYFSNEIDEVLIDDSKIYQEAKDFFSLVMPEQARLVKQHRERRPVFSRFQIEEQIDGLARNQIPLPSGGSIVIDQTEALVAIDVNSGKMSSESGIEATAGKTNLEAAVEVGRQLRLRDLGGLIVIDFIDMRDRKRIREVEHTLRASLRDDKAKVTVGRISQFGLLEMSRQRIKAALSVGAYLDCPHCQGKGRIKSVEAQAVALLRQAHAAASKGQIGRIEARTPLDVANYLLNEKRAALGDLEKQLNLIISIEGRPEFVPGQVELELLKREKQTEQDQATAPISHANQIEEALAAANQEAPDTEKPVDTAEPGETVAEDSEESTGRKRRRRRRRRGGRREEGDQQAAAPETDAASADDKQPAEASEAVRTDEAVQVVTPENVVQDETATETTEPVKPRSRGRRGARKPATAKSQEPLIETVATDKAEAENKTEAPDAATETPLDEKPKRRRTRKPAAKKVTAEATPEAQQVQSVEPQETAEKAETEDKPKRRAPRKPAAKKKPAEQPAETIETVKTETATPTDDKEKPEEKPKRRAPRKTPAKKAVAAQTETPAAEKQEAGEATDEVKAEPKPKRQPRRKASGPKTAKTPPEKTVSADEKPTIPAESKPEEKPKRRAPARKAVKQGAAQPKATEAKDSKSPAAESVEKPQRRSPKKTPAKAEAPSVETTATTAAEAPKRRTTKKAAASKTKVAASSPEPKAETPVITEKTPAEKKPKQRAPRKTTAKKAAVKPEAKVADQGEPPVVEKTPTESKPKQRAPRKKAPKKTEGPATTE